QLVHEPLAVALADLRPEVDAVHLRVIAVEARGPLADAHAAGRIERGLVALVVAEAGRADHRAVAARETALGHVGPAGVFELLEEEPGQIARAGPPLHAGRARVERGALLGDPLRRRRFARQLCEHRLAFGRPRAREEAVVLLGQREIEAARGLGPRA